MIKFSIVLPAYNAEKSIARTIKSISNIDYDHSLIEVIVVNDGSNDRTKEIIEDLIKEEKEINLIMINKSNGGVSSARNVGLKNATGDYILFLDADDKLSNNCLSSLNNFLTKNPVDITVYNITYSSNKKVHWRSEYLKTSGVYDVEDYCYAALTTVNFCIKNYFSNNQLFDEKFFMHEDEEFASRIAINSGKFGFCKEAVYHYDNANETSATNTKLNPYYSFDQSIEIYWKIIKYSINKLGYISNYAQSVIVNDFGWKLRSNVLISEAKEPQRVQLEKLKEIMKLISPSIILNHPNIDKFHQHYLIRLCGVRPNISFHGQKIMLEVGSYREHVKRNEFYISNITSAGKKILISGFYKTYITDYIPHKDIKIYALVGDQTVECKQRKTYYSYHRSKTCTNNFIGFDLNLNPDVKDISFYVSILNRIYRINRFSFRQFTDRKDLNITLSNCQIKFDYKKSVFSVLSKKSAKLALSTYQVGFKKSILKFISQIIKNNKKKYIYSDREGVFDNALWQFLHDVTENDEICKYYVCFGENDRSVLRKKYNIPESSILEYRSLQHQMLYLAASKVITSFVDASFFRPIGEKNYKANYVESFRPEIIYLQHGVLHAKTLHYAAEFLDIDKVVISTTLEEEYFKELGYREDQLIKTGAPRYSLEAPRRMNEESNIKKVLYLPSWRSYLAERKENNRWETSLDKFSSSEIYNELIKLSELSKGLDIEIDIQPHPILRNIESTLKESNFHFIKNAQYSQYDLILTDYSSVVYDIVYFGLPIVYFCPDFQQFKNGLNLYSEILTPMENGFGPLTTNANELINMILKIKNNFNWYANTYRYKYENLFYVMSDPREELYQYLRKEN